MLLSLRLKSAASVIFLKCFTFQQNYLNKMLCNRKSMQIIPTNWTSAFELQPLVDALLMIAVETLQSFNGLSTPKIADANSA